MNAEEWSLNRSLFRRPGEQGKLFWKISQCAN
jgi:hypothetical protein